MITPPLRRLLAGAPLLAFALASRGPGRAEVIALARAKFPAVMNRREPARFLVMVFDSSERYLWGFPVKGSVQVHVSGDTIALADRLAVQTGGHVPVAAERTRHDYVMNIPANVRDSTHALRTLPMNADDGLVPTSVRSAESGIEGVLAGNIVYVDRIVLYPREDAPLQFDILAVHLDAVRTDTGRPVHIPVASEPAPVQRDTTPPPGMKRAHVKRLVSLPLPVPDAVKPFSLKACFDVAPNGDATLLSWTKSLDLNYNAKVRKSLDGYRFEPATLNGVAVRDMVCITAKTYSRAPALP